MAPTPGICTSKRDTEVRPSTKYDDPANAPDAQLHAQPNSPNLSSSPLNPTPAPAPAPPPPPDPHPKPHPTPQSIVNHDYLLTPQEETLNQQISPHPIPPNSKNTPEPTIETPIKLIKKSKEDNGKREKRKRPFGPDEGENQESGKVKKDIGWELGVEGNYRGIESGAGDEKEGFGKSRGGVGAMKKSARFGEAGGGEGREGKMK